MSDYSPEVSSSGQRSTSVLKLERSLGFNFPNGLSKTSGWKREQLGRIDELYESLKYLSKIKEPAQRQDEGRDLFDVLGPGLWPRDVREARWLKTQEDYPHNLYYNDENDREKYVSSCLSHSCSRSRYLQTLGLLLRDDRAEACEPCRA
jgi:hypothetical protein